MDDPILVSRATLDEIARRALDVADAAMKAKGAANTTDEARAARGLERGEVASVLRRLVRVLRQIPEALPAAARDTRRAPPPSRPDPNASNEILLAEIRGVLDQIEDLIASVLPHRSSGNITHRFHGLKRITPTDGEAIRSDSHRLPEDELRRKWCLAGPRGVADGQGMYTRQQVATALAHDSGGHRRRRRRGIPVESKATS